MGRYPPQHVSVLSPAPTLSPSFPLAQAVFEPNLFPYKYSNIFNPSHSSYLSAYEDGTECSEMSAYKIQTPGNYPEESIQHACLRLQVHNQRVVYISVNVHRDETALQPCRTSHWFVMNDIKQRIFKASQKQFTKQQTHRDNTLFHKHAKIASEIFLFASVNTEDW